MLIAIIVTLRPSVDVPYHFESPQGRELYAQLQQQRTLAPGFLGVSVERAGDDLSIVHRVSWASADAKTIFELHNAALVQALQEQMKTYNAQHGISRKVASGSQA